MEAIELATDLADRLLEFRQALGMTQEQFVGVVNHGVSTISNWENGVTTPRIRVLRALCRHYGVDLTIFQTGGPRPSEVCLQPVNTESRGASGNPNGWGEETPEIRDDMAATIPLEDESMDRDEVLRTFNRWCGELTGPIPPAHAIQWVMRMYNAVSEAAGGSAHQEPFRGVERRRQV